MQDFPFANNARRLKEPTKAHPFLRFEKRECARATRCVCTDCWARKQEHKASMFCHKAQNSAKSSRNTDFSKSLVLGISGEGSK